jgi:RHS repeat-associated protein
MERLSGMKTSGGATIVNNVTYSAANQFLTMTFGTTTETRGYNVLNQLTTLSEQDSNWGTLENLTYNYPTGTNNGKISSTYNAVSGETATYTYDSLNRLLTANGSGWGQQYGFDAFGNLLSKTVTSGSGPSLSQAVNTANNQIVGQSYDNNGNTLYATNAGLTYNLYYDVENHLNVVYYSPQGRTVAAYGYDSQNHRLWSWPGTVDSLSNTTNYTLNIYSPSGQKLAGYLLAPATVTSNGQTTPYMQVTLSSSDAYFGSRRLAIMDRLGSNVWNSPSSSGTFFPWGEARGTYNPQDAWNFATYWQDSASGLDYANNRYYANAYGRFTTPDPYQASGGPNDPGSWNRYAYTRGDPVNRNDAQGLDDCETCIGGGGGDPGDPGDPNGYCPPSIESCAPFPTESGTGSPGSGGTVGSAGSPQPTISPACEALIFAYASGLSLSWNPSCGNPPVVAIPVAFVDCAQAIEDLYTAARLVSRRVAEAIAAGGLDAGHRDSLEKAVVSLKNALDKVEKHCGKYVGALVAIAVAGAALDAAEALLAASIIGAF